MQGYKLQRYKSQGRGHVITESAMRASSLGWSTQLPLWPSCPLKSLPLSSSFKAPDGGDDDKVATEHGGRGAGLSLGESLAKLGD